MAASITLSSTIRINGGGTISYKGSPSRCVWWELVGVNAMVETVPFGALSQAQRDTDVDGYATATYTSPTTSLGVNQWDRVRVHESIAV